MMQYFNHVGREHKWKQNRLFHGGTFNTNSGHEWYVTNLGDLSQEYHLSKLR